MRGAIHVAGARQKRGWERALFAPFFLLLCLLSLPWASTAATISATVEPAEIGIEDMAVLEIVVGAGTSGILARPELPPIAEFSVSKSGTSRNMSYVNGRMVSSVTHSYLLTPLREGTLTVPPITAKVGGKTLATEPITVKVVSGSLRTQRSARRRSVLDDPFSRRRSSQSRELDPYEHAEIRTFVDRESVYIGEQLTMVFQLATSPEIRFDQQPVYEAPEVRGGWVEPLGDTIRKPEVRAGVRWEIAEIRSAVFPTTSGLITVSPARVSGVVNAGLLDIFSMMRRSGQRLLLESEPIEVQVRPLPEAGRPANFAGAVGDFRLRASFDREQATANDPLTLTVEIIGTGNLRTTPEPPIPEVEGLRFFEPQTQSESDVKLGLLGGRRVFTRLVVPEKSGTIIFPELDLPFFDPSEERYRHARTSAIRLSILPGEDGETGPVVSGLTKEDVKHLKTDIEYLIVAPPTLADQSGPNNRGLLFWGLAALPVLAFGGAIAWRRRRDLLEGDVAFARSSAAFKRLENSSRSLRGLPAGAGEAWALACRILLDFVGDKLNLNAAGLTTHEAKALLESSAMPAGTAEAVGDFLEAADLARYAPSFQAASGSALADRVWVIAASIEKPGSSPQAPPTRDGGRRL